MDNLTEFMTKATNDLDVIRSEMVNRGRGVFKAAVKELFDTVPDLTYIMWVQYTPYFNDGDICTFSAGEVLFSKYKGELEDGYSNYYNSYYDGDFDGTYFERYQDGFSPALEAFAKFIESDEEMLQPMFGDHVFVVIRRTEDGRIEQIVDEYEHD